MPAPGKRSSKRSPALSHRRYLDGRGHRRRARRRVDVQRIVDIALSLHKKDFAALDAWSLAKGCSPGTSPAGAPEAHHCAARSSMRFADLDIPSRSRRRISIRVSWCCSARSVRMRRWSTPCTPPALFPVLPARSDPRAPTRGWWPTGRGADRRGAPDPGGSRGGGGRGPRVRRAAGRKEGRDPAARTGARRSDPGHDGGADGARHRRVAQGCPRLIVVRAVAEREATFAVGRGEIFPGRLRRHETALG